MFNQSKNIQVPIHIRTITANGQTLKKNNWWIEKQIFKKYIQILSDSLPKYVWLPSHTISNAGILYFFP